MEKYQSLPFKQPVILPLALAQTAYNPAKLHLRASQIRPYAEYRLLPGLAAHQLEQVLLSGKQLPRIPADDQVLVLAIQRDMPPCIVIQQYVRIVDDYQLTFHLADYLHVKSLNSNSFHIL